MTPTPLKISLAAALALGAAAPAMAQQYRQYVDPQAQANYEQQRQEYEAQQQDYQDRAADYQDRRDAYAVQRERYRDARDTYQQERADYDARYGSGAYDRRYGGYAYRRDRGDWYDAYRSSPCERRASGGAVTGGVIGALAGAAIGSNIAGRGDRTEGAVLGGVAGAALGATVGSSASRPVAQCDSRGYYYSFNQTYPYREDSVYEDRASGRYGYDYYRRERCRLAVAPAYYNGSTDFRYVRVCPDRLGRYRITG